MPLCPSGATGNAWRCPFAAAGKATRSRSSSTAANTDLSELRLAIKGLLEDPRHDDGSYAPLLIRLAWHCCGTFDRHTSTGGSNGGTMRFPAEQDDPENSGLGLARKLLDPLKQRFPDISTADLYVLGGYVAFEAVGGPKMQFSLGRRDFTVEEAQNIHGPTSCPFGDGRLNECGSRLPAGDLGSEAQNVAGFRALFDRLSISDRESVALILMGHSLGRMHSADSGFSDGRWTHKPTNWNLDRSPGFFSGMENDASKFQPRRAPNGKIEYMNQFGMQHLPGADMPLILDPALNAILHEYRNYRRKLRFECAEAWKKLTQLGCDGLLTPETNFNEDCMCSWNTGTRW